MPISNRGILVHVKNKEKVQMQCSSPRYSPQWTQTSRLSGGGHNSTLLNLADSFPLIPSAALLEDGLSSLSEQFELTVLNTLHPVAEAAANTGKKRVDPEGFLGEDGTHLDSELPKADGNACLNTITLALLSPRGVTNIKLHDPGLYHGQMRRLRGDRWGSMPRTEAAPEEDFVDHDRGSDVDG